MPKIPKVIIKAAQQVKAPDIPASNVVWVHKVIIAMKLPKKNIPAYIVRVKEIILGLTGNLIFATPNPALIVLNTDINALDTAQTKAKTRGVGLVALRDASFQVMDFDMDELELYLQGIIYTIAKTVSPEAAVAAAKSAMVNVKIVTIREKVGFTAEQVKGTYSVALTGTTVAKINFHTWTVVSSDPTELIRIPGSTQAKQTVQNLKKGNTYTFLHYPVTKNGELPPEAPLSVTIV